MTVSRLHRPYYRNGDNHRSGADVDFRDIMQVFGFKSAKVGQWVTKQEQQIAANLLFDALCDLQDILQVPSRVISLSGTLSIAFGTGGRKGASAHYDSSQRLLALAKNAGGGALAHEWWHAFDHYITPRLFSRSPPSAFASASWLDNQNMIDHPLNQTLSELFAKTFLAADGKTASSYLKQAVKLDQALKQFYYARPEELTARVFEAVIQDNPVKNHFLAKGTKQSQEAKLGIYPQQEYLQSLSGTLLKYFHWLGQALEQKS